MCIIMTMNIYITKDNQKYLRELKNNVEESMSGYVNRLLDNARGAQPLQVEEPKGGEPEILNRLPLKRGQQKDE